MSEPNLCLDCGLLVNKGQERHSRWQDCIAALKAAHGPDAPEWDATELAHPAWWRGQDHTAATLTRQAHSLLNGLEGHAQEAQQPSDWQSLKERLRAVRQTAMALIGALELEYPEDVKRLAATLGNLLY